jgi:hypothetical protein
LIQLTDVQFITATAVQTVAISLRRLSTHKTHLWSRIPAPLNLLLRKKSNFNLLKLTAICLLSMATDPSLNSFAAVVVNPTHCCSGRRFHSPFSQSSQPQDAGFYHDSHDSMKQISTHIWLTTVAHQGAWLPGDSQFLHPAETTVTFTVGFNPDHNPSL